VKGQESTFDTIRLQAYQVSAIVLQTPGNPRIRRVDLKNHCMLTFDGEVTELDDFISMIHAIVVKPM
jgi:hypothetical protein